MPVLDTPVTTNDASFDRVLSPGLPVLLVFTDGLLPASIETSLTKEAYHRAGQILVVKAPVVDAPQAAQRFGVARAPVLITLRNGQMHSRSTRLSASQIEQHAAYLVGEGPQPESVPPQPATSSESVPKTSASSGISGQDGIPRAVTDQTFDREVMQSSLPVVVDFWAPWCGPCRMVAPALDRMAQEMRGRLVIAKVNVDENPGISMRYGIQSIPTMMVVRDGKIVDQWAGAYPEALMRSRILKHL